MTAALVVAAFTLGTAVGTAGTYRVMLVLYDLHGYRKVALEAARVREVYADADHNHRLALRRERERDVAREQIGDLVLTTAEQRRIIARLTTRRRNPVPVYGSHR